jgi:Spy/CpxP family protein refolding chaperone
MLIVPIVLAVIILSVLTWPAPVQSGQSIYDAKVEQRLPLTREQRPVVRRIIAESTREFLAVFRKHGIDPNGPPIHSELYRASMELMAISHRERQAMRRVLTREQFMIYKQIMQEARARIRQAAQ